MAERPIGAEAKSSHARRRLTFLIVLGAAIIAGIAMTLLALKFLVFDRLLQMPAPAPSDPKNT